jgi:hypothetical protein
MNEEQIQQGRDALIALGWESGSIDSFARTICNAELKRQISTGLLPFLKTIVLDLEDTKTDLDSLITHIEEFNCD